MKASVAMKSGAVLIAVASLVACSPIEHRAAIQDSANSTKARARSELDAFVRQNDAGSPLVRKVNRPYIGSRSESLSYEAALPTVFTKMVLRLPYKRYNLSQIGDIIQGETGLPVKVSEDVFMNARDLLQTANNGEDGRQTADAAKAGTPVAPSSAMLMPVMAQGLKPLSASLQSTLPSSLADYSREMELDHRGSLAALLDRVTSRMGLSWEYDGVAIKIQRFVTKTFHVKAPFASFTETSDIGNTGESSSKEGSTYKSNLGLKATLLQNSFDSLMDQINSVKSAKGQAKSNAASMTIVVTDTKTNVDKIDTIVAEHNAIMGRQVRMQIRMITFKSNDDRDRSLDIQALYSRMMQTGSLAVRDLVTLTSPGSLASTLSGSLGVSIQNPDSRWNGSNVVMQVLDQLGTTSEQINRVLTTLNNKPAPISVTRQFSFISETTPGTSTAGVAGTTSSSIGIKQEKETVGFTMMVTPFVTSANNVTFKVAVNKRVLVRMDSASAGEGTSRQTVQQPVIDGEATQEFASVKPGETLLVSGYELDTDQFDMRNLNGDWTTLMGGSYAGRRKKETTILMITPFLVDGA